MLSEDVMARRRLAGVVAGILLLFGVVFVYVTPPYQGPDEFDHFRRAILISEGTLLPHVEDGVVGVRLPQSLIEFEQRHEYLKREPGEKYSYRQMLGEMAERARTRATTFTAFSTQAASPLLYVPALAGMGAGRLAGALSFADGDEAQNWLTRLHFARLGNLFVFTLAIAAALVAIPRFHAALCFVALLPMSLHLATIVQYDTVSLIALLGVFVVVVRKVTAPVPASRLELGVLLASAFLIGHGKVVYLPLLLVVLTAAWALPRRAAIDLVGLTAIAALLGVASSLLFAPLSNLVPGNLERQAAYLLANPAAIPALIADTFARFHGEYFRGMLGLFGWLDTPLPASLHLLLWAVFLSTVLTDARVHVGGIGLANRLAILLGIAISGLGVLISIYLVWTANYPRGVGAATVTGVQGRYFIPYLPFLAAALSLPVRRFGVSLGRSLPNLLPVQLALQAAVLAAALLFLLLRYWV
jgi:uncharacterized membrane protein